MKIIAMRRPSLAVFASAAVAASVTLSSCCGLGMLMHASHGSCMGTSHGETERAPAGQPPGAADKQEEQESSRVH